MTSGIVFVQNAFVSHAVNYWNCFGVSFLSFGQVFGIQSLDNVFDVGANQAHCGCALSACLARFLAEGLLATVELLEYFYMMEKMIRESCRLNEYMSSISGVCSVCMGVNAVLLRVKWSVFCVCWSLSCMVSLFTV